MAEVNSHPIRRAHRIRVGCPNRLGSGVVLGFPCEHIVVAPVAEMEKTAYRHEEVQSWLELFVHLRRQQGTGFRPVAQFVHRRNQRQPARHVVIAEAAGRFLDVGLEMKNRVAVFGVAVARDLGEPLHQTLRLTHHQLRNELIAQPGK